jgi:Ribbon-helix-helix protein, copG family
MDKTSVYLTEEERGRLQRLSRLERVSQAEIIRRAIRDYRGSATADRDFQAARSFDGPGDSVADLDEATLLEGFGG